MKPVWITIATEHSMGRLREKEKKSLPGVRHEQNGKWYLQYKEALAEGEPEIPTLLIISDDRLRLHRKGSYGGDMEFECRKCLKTDYRTPMGILAMETLTKRLDVFVSEDVIEVELQYDLFSDGEKVSDVAMTIRAEHTTRM